MSQVQFKIEESKVKEADSGEKMYRLHGDLVDREEAQEVIDALLTESELSRLQTTIGKFICGNYKDPHP